MSYPLPVAVGQSTGVALQVVDYTSAQTQATATGSTVELEFDQVESGYLWRVERVVITTTSAGQLHAAVYAGYPSPGNLRDATPIPAGLSGIAEYPVYLTVPSGVALTVQASGAAPGDVVTVHVQYQLVIRTGA
jgi:hypothetical protein